MEDDFNGPEKKIPYNENGRPGCAPGPVSIERRIAGMDAKITVTPEEGGDIFLVSAVISGCEKIEASLVINGWEIESIPDLSERKSFRTPVSGGSDILLVFKKSGLVLFTVDLMLERS
ncbi:MAG: hypothetical protein MUD12_16795 [Spirochaetes bacterium]|jgi:hypothetical protein|nr:hypothetical protein [Spirochaetota bacterium]